MTVLKVRKLDERATLPRYATEQSAGMDLAALEPVLIPAGSHRSVRTGLALEIPKGHEGQVRPRSGLAVRHGVTVLNAPGTIDADYRGEVLVALVNHGTADLAVRPGDRVAQLVLAPVSRFPIVEADELDATERGAGGFGSTGR